MTYWTSQFIQCLFIYVFLMYIWPSVVFRKKLTGKSMTYRFAFCSVISVLLVNSVVLGLGLLHLLKTGVVFCGFYGIFIFFALKNIAWKKTVGGNLQGLLTGTLGWKSLLVRISDGIKKLFLCAGRVANEKTKGKKVEYCILFALVVFGMIYFTYGAFQNHSYGFGDMYVHHSWIYGLIEGKIFSAGVYPEGMHCFVYVMHVLSGVPVYSIMLFLGGIHSSAFFVSVYCLLREVMHSKYTAYLVLAAFLTVDVVCVDEIFGMSRLQYTIPQEFGLYTQFLCVLYLVRFLKEEKEASEKKDDLFLFMMSLAASLAIHFYVTIMAFFLCASFAVFGLTKIFQKDHFKRLFVSVIKGVIISTIPMVIAFASGTPLQGSLTWGMNIINGSDTKEGRTQEAQVITNENSETPEIEMPAENLEQTPTPEEKAVQEIPKVTWKDRIQVVFDKIHRIYQYGYAQLYGSQRAAWILKFTIVACVLGILNWIVSLIHYHKVPFETYLGIMCTSVVFMVLYTAPYLGLPELVAGARLCLSEQIFILSMMAIPFDQVLFLIEKTRCRVLMPYLSVCMVGCIYIGAHYFDVFHGYLYYELTRYNASVSLTNHIMKAYPEYSYTVISTTDELYQVIEKGRHEEIYDFYNKSKAQDYYIPTKYLFFYIEKKPIYYAQYHFFSGPSWLAEEKYEKYYAFSNAILSTGNEIQHGEISQEKAGGALENLWKASDAYSDLTNREILESEMYAWCNDFKAKFPNEVKTYYEDEDVVCYLIKQNLDNLYNLGQ